MYNVNKEINSEGSKLNYLDVGIHENVELTNVEYKQSEEGNEFMVFTFDKEGKNVTQTEWKPKDDDPKKLSDKTVNQIKRVKHIVTKFIPEEQYEFNASSFKEFCEKTISLLGTKHKGKKVRIKVVYNYNNYTTLPNYVPFIEKMEVPKEESKIEILSIDKMTKDKADSEPLAQTNPFDTPSESVNAGSGNVPVADDRPF
jgi:hypothetical protein